MQNTTFAMIRARLSGRWAQCIVLILLALAFMLAPLSAGETKSFDLAIKDRRVGTASPTIRVAQGDRVELRWTTDEPAQLHLHGYNVETHVTPDKTVVMAFEARVAGRFPITSHSFGAKVGHGHGALAYIEVHPR